MGSVIESVKVQIRCRMRNFYGIRLDDDKKLEVRDLVLPDTVTKLRSFLGLVNFFADFIDHFAEKSHLLYALLKGKSGEKDAIP